MSIYNFGHFHLDETKRILTREGEVVSLTPKAFDLLLTLIEHQGKVIDKDYILKKVWNGNIVEEGNLSVNIHSLRKALGDTLHEHKYIVTYPNRGYSFVAEARKIESESGREGMESAGGAVGLSSPTYIERTADNEVMAAIERGDSIILVKGPRQVGKTSLLARGLKHGRQAGKRVILTDFQYFNSSSLETMEELVKALIEAISDQLKLDIKVEAVWNPVLGPSPNLERFFRRAVLNNSDSNFIWAMDEADRLFNYEYSSELFGLFRSWHNKRALEPDGPWGNLTLAIAYAAEAHLFIRDLNQSPFNVGTRIQIDDFTFEDVCELNRRYQSPLSSEDLIGLMKIIGGHPFLFNLTLREIKISGRSLQEILNPNELDTGPFSDSLLRMLLSLRKDAQLTAFVGDLLAGRASSDVASFYLLRSAGIIKGNTVREADFRCQLYRTYLSDHLN